MKKYFPGVIAIIMAVTLNSFSGISNDETVDYYFGNLGTRMAPDWNFIGQSAPNPAVDCIVNPNNDCIGKSTSAPDSNGNPTGPVTVLSTGDFAP